MILQVSNLTKHFGGVAAISNVNIGVKRNSIHGIIGPNGSGKSTLFNLISGVYRPDPGGVIVFDGQDIASCESHEIARRGVARTFQMLRIFKGMSTIENLMIGHHSRVRYGVFPAIFGTGRVQAEERRIRDEMMELLAFIGLADYADMPAGEMSGGQQRLVALARAMAARPKLLMLDEPGAGLSPPNVDILLQTINKLKDRFGLTVIIIEHILKLVMDTCHVVSVLEQGQKIAEGAPNQVKDDSRVIEAYLGKEMKDAEVRAYMRSTG